MTVFRSLPFVVLSLMLGLTSAVHAEPPATTLPAPIQEAQELLYKQRTCEARWPELMQTYGVVHSDLGNGYEIWFVPCANWNINVEWSAYVTIRESSHPDGFITNPLQFLSYSSLEKVPEVKGELGLYGANVIHNIHWDPKTKTLLARFNGNHSDNCGSISRYRWNEDRQKLIALEIVKRDECAFPGPWTQVYPRP